MAKEVNGLPKNAYRELKPEEAYTPIIPASKTIPEITTRSVVAGLFMALLFSAAAAFLGLKVAQVFEAAIPIAILAVGMSGILAKFKKRPNSILENVMIQSIGATSGAVVAGGIFTLPAIFILGLDQKVGIDILKLFLVALFGGILGILFLIPFRKYFVSDMHGKFPFPEGTAITEVIVTGEKGGKQAITLVLALGFAGIMDFIIYTLGAWSEKFTSTMLSVGQTLNDKFKMVLQVNVLASVTGLGYIIGLKYASIIVAGSFLSWFVFVPLFAHFGQFIQSVIPPAEAGRLISTMGAEDIFVTYVRHIGIGAIAAAGIMGIIRSSGVIVSAFTKGFKEMFAKTDTTLSDSNQVPRTGKDIKMSTVIVGVLIVSVLVLLFFRFSILSPLDNAWKLSFIAFFVVLIISFLFTTVAARAIAIVGTNPVSGMTLMTLILSSVILVSSGLSGDYGMLAALLIGGVVCTALSQSGAFITDLKVGYWIGSTPWNQQRFKFLGTLVSAFAVVLVIMLLNNTYGFVATPDTPTPLPAPQANAMAAVLKSLMSTEAVPWMLYAVGVILALLMEAVKVPTLAFALGMYIPQHLNTPLVIGGFIAYILGKKAKDNETGRARKDKGTLIASGFIAGGALMGVVSALIKYLEWEDKIKLSWSEGPWGEPLALAAYLLVLAYLFFVARSAKKEA